MPRGPASRLCHHRPHRLQALPLRPVHLPRLSASGLVHRQRQGRTHHHPPCLDRRPRTNGQPPQDVLGQGDLQKAKGDGGALLCRCQATSRSPLCPLPRPHEGQVAMPAGCRGAKHQEDRDGIDESTQTRLGMRSRPILSHLATRQKQADRNPKNTKNKTRRKIDGFVSGLNLRWLPPEVFCCGDEEPAQSLARST
ncbi:hypothetical protein REJC140_01646 [Pseudorhizobium endolithicum]|uniref:Transposase n=1 Tax=Pseudorhizobium endolithicum TaxID=1191678 RepID=A0ABN7JVT7_9HYPH|nr:hypothetical protein REJC140_01646 [Pseudorhizobium endolithicum]